MEDECMEQDPHNPEGDELHPPAEIAASPEAQRIREGIAEALRDGSTIDHETAWLITKHITPGSGALHDLAMTGEITPEVGTQLEIAYEVLPELADTWIAALDGYCYRREDKGPVPGWPEALDQ
jgi:hypothetical protein